MNTTQNVNVAEIAVTIATNVLLALMIIEGIAPAFFGLI
jgi:hypothetical protein